MSDAPANGPVQDNLRNDPEALRAAVRRLTHAIETTSAAGMRDVRLCLTAKWSLGMWPDDDCNWNPPYESYTEMRRTFAFAMLSAGRNGGLSDRAVAAQIADALGFDVRTVRGWFEQLERKAILPPRFHRGRPDPWQLDLADLLAA